MAAARLPEVMADADALAESVIATLGRRIVLGLPLGLGKPNHIANALLARAASDPSISLKIVTALTPEKPRPQAELHRRFIDPVVDRLFGGYPDLAYAQALRAGSLPHNIEVSEFFFLAGQWLGVEPAQQSYISANYTHAARYVLDQGVNLVAHLVARRPGSGAEATHYSLSSNPDVTPDLLAARRAGAADFLLVGQVNEELPFMEGDAAVPASEFSHVLDGPACRFPLFAPPKLPVSLADHAAALHIAPTIPDGGTLQIGIGSIGDTVAHALILRHRQNATFRRAAGRLNGGSPALEPPEDGPFETGLHGLSEMLVDSFLDLIDAGVVKRAVDGKLLHAAFFLGPKAFYARLRDMSEAERARIAMKPVSFVNALYGQEPEKRRARVKARFVNNAMMATLLGAVVSDGLEDGRVVSGVGGQHDFVTQAFALEGARSIITLGATRIHRGRAVSNIRWDYPHQTIPRHLRDMVATEYGLADLRGKSDSDVIAAMLGIADSRFQGELLRQAKDAGKIAREYQIPPEQRDNTPERIESALGPLREDGLLPAFPFGTDFTETEQRLMPALERIRQASHAPWRLASMALRGLGRAATDADAAALERMGLAAPSGLKERVYRGLLLTALRETSDPDSLAPRDTRGAGERKWL